MPGPHRRTWLPPKCGGRGKQSRELLSSLPDTVPSSSPALGVLRVGALSSH